MTESSLAMVTSTLAPGLRPIFLRNAAGMTTCPLAEVVTTGIDVHLLAVTLNVNEMSIT